jgi:phytoene/squalene synthetase
METPMPTLTPDQVEEAARAMPDHTLATSFLEPSARARVIALILFAYEIARARAVASEPGLAAIRLQWWRDTLDQIYSGKIVRAQPIAIALRDTVQEANLPRNLLDAMIEGHERELEATPFTTWADVEAYLDATAGNLNRLSLLASGLPSLSRGGHDAARHTAVAWGLSYLLRATPYWASRRCLWLPTQYYEGLDLETVFAGGVSAPLRELLAQAKDRISTEHHLANEALKTAKLGPAFAVLASATLAWGYGKSAIPKVGPTWGAVPDITLLERQLRLTISIARGRI